MTVHITVEEEGEKKLLNTPGGHELLIRLGGPAGLPFFAFLDGKGVLITNSIRLSEGGKPSGNIGHPYEPVEVDWFLIMLHKAVPAMTAQETATLERWLRSQKK